MSAKFLILATLGVAALLTMQFNKALAEEGAYEIIKTTENVAWRLNKKTGEISACRFTGDTMTCASSEVAVVRPKTSFEDFKKEKKQDRAERQAEDLAMLDRLFAYFKKMLVTVKELEETAPEGKIKADTEAK